MKAKDYLSKLEKLDTVINQKLEELYNLRSSVSKLNSSIEKERVQTSKISNIANTIVHIVDLDNVINNEIDNYIDTKHTIINEIQGLDNMKHIQLLYKRYVQYKSFESIAVEMNYAYQYVIELHGYALKAFERTYKNL